MGGIYTDPYVLSRAVWVPVWTANRQRASILWVWREATSFRPILCPARGSEPSTFDYVRLARSKELSTDPSVRRGALSSRSTRFDFVRREAVSPRPFCATTSTELLIAIRFTSVRRVAVSPRSVTSVRRVATAYPWSSIRPYDRTKDLDDHDTKAYEWRLSVGSRWLHIWLMVDTWLSGQFCEEQLVFWVRTITSGSVPRSFTPFGSGDLDTYDRLLVYEDGWELARQCHTIGFRLWVALYYTSYVDAVRVLPYRIPPAAFEELGLVVILVLSVRRPLVPRF